MNEIKISTGFTAKDNAILRSFTDRKLIKIRHEKLVITNTVMCVVELHFEDSIFSLIASQDAIRYYRAPVEDVSCFHIHEGANPYDMIKLIDDAVGSSIDKVTVVTDTVRAAEKDVSAVYVNSITAGIVFTFTDGHELGLERFDDFIEGIDIHKGYNVLDKFANPDYWIDGLKEDFDCTVKRSLEVIE